MAGGTWKRLTFSRHPAPLDQVEDNVKIRFMQQNCIFKSEFINHRKIRKILTSKITHFKGGKTGVSMIIPEGVQK